MNGDPETEPVRRGPDPPKDHAVRDLLLILGVVFAALQVLPSYIASQSLLFPFVIATVALGAAAFLLLRYARRWQFPGWKACGLILLFLANFGFALYSQYSIRKRDQLIATEQEIVGATGPLKKYLIDVFEEHSGEWGGEFEKRYARPTLFQLSDAAMKQRPDTVQDSILLWRAGVKASADYFVGLSCFPQRDLEQASENSGKIAEKFLHYVARPMADSDLLNKKRSGSGNDASAGDDIPSRILVLGDPASGKSTMLERLDMIQARRARGSKDEPVPVLIKLKGLDGTSREALLAKIRERLGPAADLTLKQRTIILFIDALDEASDPRKTARAIYDLLTASEIDRCVDRTIVTARVLEYAESLFGQPEDLTSVQSNFKTVLLYGLDQTAIEKQVLGSDLPPTRKQLVLRKLTDPTNGQIWLQFLRLPMNFHLLSEIMADRDSNDIPRIPSEVLARFVQRRFNDKKITPADSDHCQNILARAAAVLLTDVKSRSRPFSAEDCARSSAAGDTMPIPLDVVESRLQQAEQTGLIKKEPRAAGKFRFFHLNLQDYFGARGLTNISVIDPKDVNWRQVILFRAGMNDGESVEKLIKEAQTTLASPKADGNQKNREMYLRDLQSDVESIRSAVRHIGTLP